ncbi:lysozyme inhibitor LprI family protein [Bradyrhizobium sp. JYMT SZCCT0428]|uniref:lysozyme inhibitor LprI family protein n=1 Tax=Bradyrhizobium sp. JYMT SZCCT0428 TaxID=2807673 RepID=UPI001BA487C1|nr:lysozyme inhibitor LprI family protein [Bradyrhizobium sp. JYMT SZCCT0428]MBR1151050.1 DUF1311 domain-containing protein [Bradyrhizobium sp. JYMT SZCCT0428]
MSASPSLAALAIMASVLIPTSCYALDTYLRALSSGPTGLSLCGTDGPLAASDACKQSDYDALTAKIEKALQASLAKAPANIRPLLKRDQAWFNEIMLSAAGPIHEFDDEEIKEAFVETLRQRATTVEAIKAGFGRAGFLGTWVNTFGSITVAASDGGGYRLAFDTRAVYGLGSDRRRACKAGALVKPSSGGWLTGTMLPDDDAPAKADDGVADTRAEPVKPILVKVRRQGETLRVVLGDTEWRDEDRPNCEHMGQITGSYFASGKQDAAAGKADTTFVAPTFDCSRPGTASEEEVCADPDMAENDQKLNRAWKALLPRLDEATRRALTEDQRSWVKSQTNQYPQFLHPAWEKQTSQMHYTADARDKLERLQRERIALIEGFDDKRSGLAGTWLAYNAVLQVTVNRDGSVTAKGWKWDQGDWKAGCDYEISGRLVDGGAFRSSDGRKNPDTLERDHATLVVNRQDDAFAKKRWKKDGTEDDNADEPKCRRNLANSSTARLFPAHPSPDIDNMNSSIR